MKVPRQSRLSRRGEADLTRRGLMRRGLGLAAAAAFARDAGAAVEAISPTMDRLSAYMSEASSRAIPDAVVQETIGLDRGERCLFRPGKLLPLLRPAS